MDYPLAQFDEEGFNAPNIFHFFSLLLLAGFEVCQYLTQMVVLNHAETAANAEGLPRDEVRGI